MLPKMEVISEKNMELNSADDRKHEGLLKSLNESIAILNGGLLLDSENDVVKTESNIIDDSLESNILSPSSKPSSPKEELPAAGDDRDEEDEKPIVQKPATASSQGVTCGECSDHFRSLKNYMEHDCLCNRRKFVKTEHGSDSDDISDAEVFDGQIIYQPDGSAYIFENVNETGPPQNASSPQCQPEAQAVGPPPTSVQGDNESCPNVALFNISDPSTQLFYSPFVGSFPFAAVQSMPNVYLQPPGFNMTNQQPYPPVVSGSQSKIPIMQSYRVFSVRRSINPEDMNGDEFPKSDGESKDKEITSNDSVGMGEKETSLYQSEEVGSSMNKTTPNYIAGLPVASKPVLMCFLCKLSFAYVKSFSMHAVNEHKIEFMDKETELLSKENPSAVIQPIGKKREPLILFLEPTIPIPSPTTNFNTMYPGFLQPFMSAAMSSSSSPIFASMCNSVVPSSTNIVYQNSQGLFPQPGALPSSMAVTSGSTSPHCTAQLGISSAELKETAAVHSPMSPHQCVKLEPKSCENGPAETPESKTMSDVDESPPTDDGGHDDPTPDQPLLEGAEPMECDDNDDEIDEAVSAGNSKSAESADGVKCEPLNLTTGNTDRVSEGSTPLPCASHCDTMSSFITTNVSGISTLAALPSGFMKASTSSVECPKCDMILGSSRSLGGHMTMMHSRNSCKTLKCPKCNWHYKYQQTLDAHMKEKHPEANTQCSYCVQNKAHPRLARGETYTCGYKPFRCEICNYSTTTKGNLSIHMQSDKHVNNVQELQNRGREAMLQQTTIADAASTKSKSKPTWRCDVCDYETNVARNLRIHMGSEKHTQNVISMHQTIQHMTQQGIPVSGFFSNSAIMNTLGSSNTTLGMMPMKSDTLSDLQGFYADPSSSMFNSTDSTRSCLPSNVDSMKLFQCSVCNNFETDDIDMLHVHIHKDRNHIEEAEWLLMLGDSIKCKLCDYSTTLKANFQLHCKTDKHVQKLQLVKHIKEGGKANEWRLKYINLSNPIQVKCNSCDYYTNSVGKMRAHISNMRHVSSMKLLRHLQQFDKHFNSESKIYHCALCNYSSQTKINLIQHVRSMGHQRNENICRVQLTSEGKDEDEGIKLMFTVQSCAKMDGMTLCAESRTADESRSPLGIERRSDQISPLSDREVSPCESPVPATCNTDMMDRDSDDDTHHQPTYTCPYCHFNTTTLSAIDVHVLAQHSIQPAKKELIKCPLCQKSFTLKSELQGHLMETHSVSPDCVDKLISTVETTTVSTPSTSTPAHSSSGKNSTATISDDLYRCQKCHQVFNKLSTLYQHQADVCPLDMKQTPNGPGYLCWKKGCNQYFKTLESLQMHFQEIHAKFCLPSKAFSATAAAASTTTITSTSMMDRYTCNNCKLVFDSREQLQVHSQYHMLDVPTTCSMCQQTFASVTAIQHHIEMCHPISLETSQKHESAEQVGANDETSGQRTHLTSIYPNVKHEPMDDDLCDQDSPSNNNQEQNDMGIDECMADGNGMAVDDNVNDSVDSVDDSSDMSDRSTEDNCEATDETPFIGPLSKEDLVNTFHVSQENYSDCARKYKCHRCRVAFTRQRFLMAHHKTSTHRKGVKSEYPVEKYMDPGRPYKCATCKESFTQKNILLVHYNSVSHLNKLKRTLHDPENVEIDCADKKPFKCTICNVSYSQGSTLDIHMRSVLHQSRAAKADINLNAIQNNKPESAARAISPAPNQQDECCHVSKSDSIEYSCTPTPTETSTPVPKHIHSPQISSEAPKSSHSVLSMVESSVNSSSLASSMNSSNDIQKIHLQLLQQQQQLLFSQQQHNLFPDFAGFRSYLDPLALFQAQSMGTPTVYSCNHCSSIFTNQESLMQHQQLHCFLSDINVNNNSVSLPITSISANTSCNAIQAHSSSKTTQKTKCVQRQILRDIGLDIVMHYAENSIGGLSETLKEAASKSVDPQLGIFKCNHCVKSFSSIWILKTHEEEVHSQLISTDDVEKMANIIREEIDKSLSDDSQDTSLNNTTSSTGAGSATPLVDHMTTPLIPMTTPLIPPPPPLAPIPQPSVMFAPPFPPPPSIRQPYETIYPNVLEHFEAQYRLQQQSQQQSHTKRPRTRITDEQLKILRAYFDINNSPSEEQIIEMSEKSGLPQKVIKHWFRNTLFKERQRNKDSPYNFNNPPATVLTTTDHGYTATILTTTSDGSKRTLTTASTASTPTSKIQSVKTESQSPKPSSHGSKLKAYSEKYHEHNAEIKPLSLESTLKVESGTMRDMNEDKLGHVEKTMNFHKTSLLERDQIGGGGRHAVPMITSDNMIPSVSSSVFSQSPLFLPSSLVATSSIVAYPHFSLSTGAMGVTSTPTLPTAASMSGFVYPTTSTSPLQTLASMSDSKPMESRRAGRTRFTDFQIKRLQEFFDTNAYPKDDDLDRLSKELNLNPRVIVVWFQNARQKARKSFENLPPLEGDSGGEGRYIRTPGLNYQCKKCMLVFQRFIDLIKHQRQQCFREDDTKCSAATAEPSTPTTGHTRRSSSSYMSGGESNSSNSSSKPPDTSPTESSADVMTYPCNKCSMVFPKLDLWQEHQRLHLLNSFNPFMPSIMDNPYGLVYMPYGDLNMNSMATASASGLPPAMTALSNAASLVATSQASSSQSCNPTTPTSNSPSPHHSACTPQPASNAKPSKDAVVISQMASASEPEPPRDRRLRTTITPEQLEILYEKYQENSNPSRRMLDIISREVGLKKRVVQVWFQNTRARQRKGQIRAVGPIYCHRRCPYCRAMFKAKTALDAHIGARHWDKVAAADRSGCLAGKDDQAPNEPVNGDYDDMNVDDDMAHDDMAHDDSLEMERIESENISFHSDSHEENGSANLMDKGHSSSADHHPDKASASFISDRSDEKCCQDEEVVDDVDMFDDCDDKLVIDHSDNDGRNKNCSESRDDLDCSSNKSYGSEHGHAPSDTRTSTPVSRGLSSPVSSGDDMYSNITNFDNSRNSSQMVSPSGTSSPRCSTSPSNLKGKHNDGKRFRTQMSNTQLKVLKHCFTEYRTPTMQECELLGSCIGLQKRVVQVWFQNARAKEKKSKLSYAKTFGVLNPPFETPKQECKLCGVKYSIQMTVRDHIFTEMHINKLKQSVGGQTPSEKSYIDSLTGMSQVLSGSQDAHQVPFQSPSTSSSTSSFFTPTQISPISNMQTSHLSPLTPYLPPPPLRSPQSSHVSPPTLPKIKQEVLDEPKISEHSKLDSSGSSNASQSSSNKSIPYDKSSPSAYSSGAPSIANFVPSASGFPFLTSAMPSYYMQYPFLQPVINPVDFQLPFAHASMYGRLMGESAAPHTSTSPPSDTSSVSDEKASGETAKCEKHFTNTASQRYMCRKCLMVFEEKSVAVAHQQLVCYCGQIVIPDQTLLTLSSSESSRMNGEYSFDKWVHHNGEMGILSGSKVHERESNSDCGKHKDLKSNEGHESNNIASSYITSSNEQRAAKNGTDY